VPWNRLPEVHRIAHEVYDALGSYRSWTRLLLRFIFDRRLSLFSRQVRENRGRVSLDSEVKPDVELVETAGYR
jgi:sphingolipid delta-4 desaturase